MHVKITMKLTLKSAVLIFLFTTLFFSAKAQQTFLTITDYKVYYGWAHHYPQDWIILREFKNNNKAYYLLVNPQTLVTKIDVPGFYEVKPMTFDAVRKLFSNSPYVKALDKAEKQDVNIQDAGIENGLPKETGISLTADLCPSHRPLDRRIFTDIISEFGKVEHPVPIALSITGIWMRQHQQDLTWLKGLQREGYIYITWINHSFNHRVSATLPLKHNFLLEAGTDIYYEVTETEKAMLKNGLLPSAFFQVPRINIRPATGNNHYQFRPDNNWYRCLACKRRTGGKRQHRSHPWQR